MGTREGMKGSVSFENRIEILVCYGHDVERGSEVRKVSMFYHQTCAAFKL
jgi:hypothetical protein